LQPAGKVERACPSLGFVAPYKCSVVFISIEKNDVLFAWRPRLRRDVEPEALERVEQQCAPHLDRCRAAPIPQSNAIGCAWAGVSTAALSLAMASLGVPLGAKIAFIAGPLSR